MTHDKMSFTKEYCRCRRIPYRFKNETLIIDGRMICYSIYNINYADITKIIDNSINYNRMGFYESVKRGARKC